MGAPTNWGEIKHLKIKRGSNSPGKLKNPKPAGGNNNKILREKMSKSRKARALHQEGLKALARSARDRWIWILHQTKNMLHR